MKIVDSFVNSLIYIAYIIGACLCAAAVDLLTLKILNEFLVISLYAQTIIRVVIYTIAPIAVIAVVSFKEGYREARFSLGEVSVSCVFASVGMFLVALLFRFNRFLVGGVKYISSLIAYGQNLSDADQITNVGYRYAIPVFFGLFVVYSVVLAIFKKLGADKRLLDRAELTETQVA